MPGRNYCDKCGKHCIWSYHLCLGDVRSDIEIIPADEPRQLYWPRIMNYE